MAKRVVMDAEAEALRQPPELTGERVRPDTPAVSVGAYQRVGCLAHPEPQELFGLSCPPSLQLIKRVLPERHHTRFARLRRPDDDLVCRLLLENKKSHSI